MGRRIRKVYKSGAGSASVTSYCNRGTTESQWRRSEVVRDGSRNKLRANPTPMRLTRTKGPKFFVFAAGASADIGRHSQLWGASR